jgi:hypothetical protein
MYLLIASVQFQSQLQANDLSLPEVHDESTQKVYDWINRRDKDAEMSRSEPIVDYFPNGPHEKSLGKVDIVVITPDSTPSRQPI